MSNTEVATEFVNERNAWNKNALSQGKYDSPLVVKGWHAHGGILSVSENGKASAVCVHLHCGTTHVHVESALSIEDAEKLVSIIKKAISEAKAIEVG